MKDEKQLIERLESHRTKAPEGFAGQVMDALPAFRKKRARGIWPSAGQWIAPSLAGVAATLLILFVLGHFQPVETKTQVGFHFELHAPGADRVELLGTFNNWKMGDIVLDGPDASGHWTATVELPQGRHEYIFLVDGERWVADPKGMTHRPDGFGRVNTVIKVYDENNA
jgi:hypothetical protein